MPVACGQAHMGWHLRSSSPTVGGKQRAFASQWPHIAKVPVTEALVSRAEALASDFALRGYDAVQLASALTWQEAVGAEITLATFDRQLWDAGKKAGVQKTRVWWPRFSPVGTHC
jgi:predicted nucleic acid-binding protein